jgi:hypothetical protein
VLRHELLLELGPLPDPVATTLLASRVQERPPVALLEQARGAPNLLPALRLRASGPAVPLPNVTRRAHPHLTSTAPAQQKSPGLLRGRHVRAELERRFLDSPHPIGDSPDRRIARHAVAQKARGPARAFALLSAPIAYPAAPRTGNISANGRGEGFRASAAVFTDPTRVDAIDDIDFTSA